MSNYLQPVYLTSFSIPDAWFEALGMLVKNEDKCNIYAVDFGSAGKTVREDGTVEPGLLRYERDFTSIHILNPGMRPLHPIIPDGLGIPPVTTVQKIEDYFATYILHPGKAENEDYSYGERICISVEEVCRKYREQGFGQNQCTIEIAKPEDIFLDSPPCCRSIDTKISKCRETGVYRLHFYIYFRSWNLWGGFPENLGGMQLLKEWMVKQIGDHPDGTPLVDGEMIVSSKSLNVREDVFELVKKRLYISNADVVQEVNYLSDMGSSEGIDYLRRCGVEVERYIEDAFIKENPDEGVIE